MGRLRDLQCIFALIYGIPSKYKLDKLSVKQYKENRRRNERKEVSNVAISNAYVVFKLGRRRKNTCLSLKQTLCRFDEDIKCKAEKLLITTHGRTDIKK